MQKMPGYLDRRRLKDRIIENVSKAIKQIQDRKYRCFAPDDEAVFVNDNWHLCRLVEHLDHAFLHGLRHISSGYWVIIREFTHKTTVRDIRILSNVTTDLGRSRAWLYIALNDQLLESYLRCFLANTRLVSRYYVKEALVLDRQRMEILLMLSAGLEYVRFQLDVDMAYLDLSSHLRVRETRQSESDDENGDRVSLCSMESSLSSQTSGFASDSHCCMTDSLDSADISNEVTALPAANRFANIQAMTSLDLSSQSDDLEVIRVKRKNHKKGKSKGQRKSPTETDTSSVSSCTPSPLSPESAAFPTAGRTSPQREKNTIINHQNLRNCDKHVVNQDPVAKHRLLDIEQSILTDCSHVECMCDQSVALVDGRCTQCNNLRTVTMENIVQNGPIPSPDNHLTQAVVCDDHVSPCEPAHEEPMGLPKPASPKESFIPDARRNASQEDSIYDSRNMPKMKIPRQNVGENHSWDMTNNLTDITNMQERRPLEYVKNSLNDSAVIVDTCDKALKINSHREHNLQSTTSDNKVDKDSSMINPKDINVESDMNNMVTVDRLIYTYDVDLKKPKEACADIKNNLEKESSCPSRDVQAMADVKSPEMVVLEENEVETKPKKDVSEESSEQQQQHLESERESMMRSRRTPQECEHHAEVRVDNNLLLLLMLHIFEEEEEQIIKMFRTCLSHTDGDIQPMFLLITTSSIYLLTATTAESRFNKEISLNYRELDYISVGVHHQLLHIVCTNRLKQYFLTTGDEQLTKIIIREIDEAIEASESALPKLTVLTDATAQKIAMRKWAAKEGKVSVDKVKLSCYSMVHWEDKQADNGRLASIGVKKEGFLLYKSHNFLDIDMLSTWKPSYFILRDGLLMQFSEKKAKSAPKNIIQLVGGECVGCRRSRQSDREHSFELMLTDGGCLQLSAASDEEAREWLQCLCQAVSEGLGLNSPGGGSIACCCLVTETKLLTFHEDTHTSFFRTLGSANVVDVTSVLIDHENDTVTIVIFEAVDSFKSSDQWILFFNSRFERDKFVCSLCQIWGSHYQVSLPVNEIEDSRLQTCCQETRQIINDRLKP